MSNSNLFGFSTSSSFSPGSGRENEFTFSVGPNHHNGERRGGYAWRRTVKSRLPNGGAMAAASSRHGKTTSSLPISPNRQQSSPPSTRKWIAKEKELTQNTKTRWSQPSAVTGVISCYFEGSIYSSIPFEQIHATVEGKEESNKKGRHGKDEPNSSSSQIIVSRILKGIPQSPHFWPLRRHSEISKPSLINAWDRVFEQTCDQIQSIQLNGFFVNAKRLWETMEELQKMGYNVVFLRRRLVELTDVILSLRTHRSKIMGLKCKAEYHRMEKSRLEFEIVKLTSKVEAEKVSFGNVMAKVAKMEDEIPNFNDVFTKLATKVF